MVTVRLDPGDIGRTTMKVDTCLLGHWPSEQERLHIGAAVAPVEYNPKDQAPGRGGAPEARLASSWHLGAGWQPAMFCRWLSLASGAVDWRNGMPEVSGGFAWPVWRRRYGRDGVPQHD
jgi:hypothetical protein